MKAFLAWILVILAGSLAQNHAAGGGGNDGLRHNKELYEPSDETIALVLKEANSSNSALMELVNGTMVDLYALPRTLFVEAVIGGVDAAAVTAVGFSYDGVLVGTKEVPPYEVLLTTGTYANTTVLVHSAGTHTLSVTASFNGGAPNVSRTIEFTVTDGGRSAGGRSLAQQEPFLAWNVLESVAQRTTSLKQKVVVNHERLVKVLTLATEDRPVAISFVIEGGYVRCALIPSTLMAPELQAKYPQIMVFAGKCEQDGMVTLVINEDAEQSLSTTYYNSKGELYYVDYEHEDFYDEQVYTLVKRSDLFDPQKGTWSDIVLDDGGWRQLLL